ncbi:protein FAM210A [Pimephales promelas]|nr:protein FAM210A [Pimephales promelas]
MTLTSLACPGPVGGALLVGELMMWAPVALRRVVLLRSAYLGHTRAVRELPVTVRTSRCFSCTNVIRTKEAPKTSTEEETPLNPPQSLAGTEGLFKGDTESGLQMWFGSFYYAAMKGVNLIPFLEFIGLPDWMVGILRDSQGGYALTAYAMYKLATPARYTVTLGGTSLSVQYLRKHGYLLNPSAC